MKEAGRYYALFPCLPRSSHLFPPTRPAFCGKVKENAENLNLLILELPRPSNELTCFLSLPFPAYVSRTLSCSSPCSSLSLSLSLWAVCKRITLFPLPFSAVLQTHMEQRIGFEEILTKCTAAMVPSISTPGLSPPTDPPQCVCVCLTLSLSLSDSLLSGSPWGGSCNIVTQKNGSGLETDKIGSFRSWARTSGSVW